MKYISLVTAIFLFGITCSFGQIPSSADSIMVKKTFGGYQFYKSEKRLTVSELVNIMKPNTLAFEQIQSAQSTYVIANIVGGVGGFLIGWPLGTAIGGGKPNWALAGVGAGLFVVSIPITQKFNKQAKQAVDTYNRGSTAISSLNLNELTFSASLGGLGLKLTF